MRDILKVVVINFYMFCDKILGKKVIIFNISSSGFTQFLIPVYNCLKANAISISFYLSIPHKMKEELSGFDISAIKRFNSRINKYLFFSDAFIEPEIWDRGPENSVKIMIGHGQPNKHTNWSAENLKAFDVYFLYGALLREQIMELQKENWESWKHIKLVNIGYPKTDNLFNGTFNKTSVLKELGLNPEITTILYAPAWDPGGSLRTVGEQIIEELLKLKNINLIVKLHPASLESPESKNYYFYTGGVNWIEKFEKYIKHDNFRHVSNYNINPLHIASDIMITDFSGVALEFMTQDKPVIYFDCPEFYQKTLIEWGQDPILAKESDLFNSGRNYGIIVYNISELIPAVERSIRYPLEFSDKRKIISEKFLYNPGRGAEKAAEAILELINK